MSLIDQILDGPFTFSINCRSGFVGVFIVKCECWRCRKQRGEQPDEELAASIAATADAEWAVHKKSWIEFLRMKLGYTRICTEDELLQVLKIEKTLKEKRGQS